jgi:hypothetical protein
LQKELEVVYALIGDFLVTKKFSPAQKAPG